MFDRFLSILSLVSRFPVKGGFTFDPSRMDFYLPITGLFPACLGALVFSLSALLTGDRLITVLLLLAFQYLGFNLFHLDGLLDSADAFLGRADREKRFAILKDSRIGVYGFFAGITALTFKTALLLSLYPLIPYFPAALLSYPLSGRLSGAIVPCLTGPAKPDGLGALSKGAQPGHCALGFLTSLILWTLIVWGSLTLIALMVPDASPLLGEVFPSLLLLFLPPICSLLGGGFFAGLYRKHLGGYTGDALGAAIESAEILHLTVAFILVRILEVCKIPLWLP
jgi:adenosylcobinamide-GDP ribazoletransferase